MRIHRAAPSAYATFATISGTIALLWGLAVWRAGAPWKPLLIPVGGFALAALWLSRFRVSMDEERVEIRSPFGGRRSLSKQDVLSVEFAESPGKLESPATLCIRTSEGTEVRLNVKVFAPHVIQDLLALSKHPRKAA